MYFNQYLKNNTFTTDTTTHKLSNRATYRDALHLKIKTNRLPQAEMAVD